MGILTDFFVASPEELRSAFPTWLEVADEPVMREVENPFTQQVQQVETWLPKNRPAIHASDEDRLGNFRQLPHAEFKGVDIAMLAALHVLLSDVTFEQSLKQFARPALIDPWESDETGLEQFGADFINALAGLDANNVQGTATEWAAGDGEELYGFSAEDCRVVLSELVRLAKTAIATNRNLYHSWSL